MQGDLFLILGNFVIYISGIFWYKQKSCINQTFILHSL